MTQSHLAQHVGTDAYIDIGAAVHYDRHYPARVGASNPGPRFAVTVTADGDGETEDAVLLDGEATAGRRSSRD
jgi:hypothetical protein